MCEDTYIDIWEDDLDDAPLVKIYFDELDRLSRSRPRRKSEISSEMDGISPDTEKFIRQLAWEHHREWLREQAREEERLRRLPEWRKELANGPLFAVSICWFLINVLVAFVSEYLSIRLFAAWFAFLILWKLIDLVLVTSLEDILRDWLLGKMPPWKQPYLFL